MGNFFFKFLFILHFVFSNGWHIPWLLLLLWGRVESQNSSESRNKPDKFYLVQSFKHWNVGVNEFGVFNVVHDAKIVDSVPDVFNCIDGFRSGWSCGQDRKFLVFSFEEKFSGVGSINKGSSLGFDSDFSFRCLLVGFFK